MKKLALTVCVISAAMMASVATAKTFNVEQDDRSKTCYKKVYVKATYQVDTKGSLVRGATRTTSGLNGDWVVIKDEPAIYLPKKTLIEEGHYTLVKKKCH